MENYITASFSLHVTVHWLKIKPFYCSAAYFGLLLMIIIMGICLENNRHVLLELGNRIMGKIKRIIYQGLISIHVLDSLWSLCSAADNPLLTCSYLFTSSSSTFFSGVGTIVSMLPRDPSCLQKMWVGLLLNPINPTQV